MEKVFLSLAPLLLCIAPCFAQTGEYDSLSLSWEHYTLSNGLQVILQPDLSQQNISIEFWLHAGSRNESPGQHGLAHFFEHATPYGLSEDEEGRALLKSYRTNSNAQTRKDYTRYYIEVKPEGLEIGLNYTADRLKADTSAITSQIIEKHRVNVLAEIERNAGNPFWGARATSGREAGTFGETHPYGHSTYGTRQENQNFTANDVKRWYKKYIFASNTILFVIGHFDVAKTKALIESRFEDIHRKNSAINFRAATATHSPGKKTIEVPAETHVLSLTWATSKWDVADAAALGLLANILDQRLAALDRGDISIREAESGYLLRMYEWAGQFGVLATFSSLRDSSRTESWLRNTVDGVIKSGVSNEEVGEALQQEVETVKKMLTKLGFIGSRTELLGEGLLFTGKPDFYLTRLRRQSELAPVDIQTAAKRWLNREAFRLLTVTFRDEEESHH